MLREYLSSIANALRSKLETADKKIGKINAQSFPDKINEVYEKGKYDEWSELWDSIQTNGDGWTSYDNMFNATSWNDKTFRPKYNFRINGGCAVGLFGGNCRVTDLEEAFKKGGVDGQGVKIVQIGFGHFNQAFTSNSLTVIPEVDLSNCTGVYLTFSGANIHTIRKIISSKTTNWGTSCFSANANSKLKHVVIEGVIAKTLTLQYQKELSADSIFSFIEALCPDADVAGVSITFNQFAVNNIPFPYTSPKTGITYTSWDDEGDATSVKSLSPSNWSISAL